MVRFLDRLATLVSSSLVCRMPPFGSDSYTAYFNWLMAVKSCMRALIVIKLGSCLAEPFMIGFKARYTNEKQVFNSFKNF